MCTFKFSLYQGHVPTVHWTEAIVYFAEEDNFPEHTNDVPESNDVILFDLSQFFMKLR